MNEPSERVNGGDAGFAGNGRSGDAPGNDGWAAVLFDLDGTLADTVPFILECYRHTMLTHRGCELPDQDWLRTIGTPLRDQLRAFATSDEEVLAMVETYVSFQRVHHDQRVRPFPGARTVLESLAGRGARLAVVTSKGREMTGRTLDACGLGDLLALRICADDVRRGKPDPEPVHLALRTLGLGERKEEVLFVGDSPFDVVAGRGAGVRTAAALWGAFAREALEAADPHHVVGCMEDLLELRPLR
jgi:pyrophosphatase PpaX